MSAVDRSILRVALLGCGTVGGAVARRLLDPEDAVHRALPTEWRLVSVLVRQGSRPRPCAPEVVTDRFEDLRAARPDVVIEAMGGREPARSHVADLVSDGVAVVTANKSMVAAHGRELGDRAAQRNVPFRYEASVGAAVPVLAALDGRRGDRLLRIRAVINGTCNDVLTRMESEGISLDAAVARAQSLGLAERDPSADLSGRDSLEKLQVMAMACGLSPIESTTDPGDECRGVERISLDDLASARRRGCRIRLVASLEVGERGGSPCSTLRVGPVVLPHRHPLASARGAENVVLVESEPGGALLLRGEGAGPGPTASALLGDLLACAAHRRTCSSAGPCRRVPAVAAARTPAVVTDVPTTTGVAPESALHSAADAARRWLVRLTGRPVRAGPRSLFARLDEAGLESLEASIHGEVAEAITAPAPRAALDRLESSAPAEERCWWAETVA